MAVAGFVLQGSMGKSPLSRGWIMMPHAKSVQPGADKITSAWQLSHTHDGGCLWLCGLSLTLHLRLGGSYVPKAGLRLTPILLAQLPKRMEYTSEPHNDRDYADSTQCALCTLKIPSCLHSGFQTQSLSWFAFVFNTHVFKLPIRVI